MCYALICFRLLSRKKRILQILRSIIFKKDFRLRFNNNV